MRDEDGIWRRQVPERQYRWRCGLRNGRWRPTHELAGDAAVSAGLATWEQFGRRKQLHLGPLVEIEERAAPARRTQKKRGRPRPTPLHSLPR